MNFEISPELVKIIVTFVTLAVGAFVAFLVLFVWAIFRIKRIELPPNADWLTAMRLTPLPVVIMLDLLDLALDIFSAPVSWLILSYFGLAPLRGAVIVESLIPGTQALPTMTVAWILARLIRSKPGLDKILS